MADVTRDRGQIILITGFALAFALVAIVLLLNTVIYTENIASRGIDRSADQALEFRNAVTEGLGDTLVQTNLDGHDTTTAAETTFRDSVSNLSQMFSRIHLDEGTIAELNTSTLSMHPGALLQQTNRSRNFSSIDHESNWVLANNVDDTRRVRLFVTRSSLESGDITNLLGFSSFDPFGVRLVGGSTNWTVYLAEDTNTGNISLSTSQGGGSLENHCSINAANAAIHLTGDGIQGVDCPGYEWAEGISSDYDIRFIEAGDVEGSYNLTVNGSGTVDSNFNTNPGTSPDPHKYGAVYSASIPIHYQTTTMVYDTVIEVAPGEDDDD